MKIALIFLLLFLLPVHAASSLDAIGPQNYVIYKIRDSQGRIANVDENIRIFNNILQTQSANTAWLNIVNEYIIDADFIPCDVLRLIKFRLDNTNFLLFLPNGSGCSFIGLGTVGTWFTGYKFAIFNGDVPLRIIGHEIGHNFGLNHSYSLFKGERIEYNNPYDFMGMGDRFSNATVSLLGWPSMTKELKPGKRYRRPVNARIAGTNIFLEDVASLVGHKLDDSGAAVIYLGDNLKRADCYKIRKTRKTIKAKHVCTN